MFRELNEELKKQIPTFEGDPIFELHPAQLYGWLEAVWETWRRLGESSPPATVGLADTSARAVVVGLGAVNRDDIDGRGIFLSDPILALLHARDSGLFSSPTTRLDLDVERAAITVLGQMFRPSRRGLIPTPWLHLMYAYLVENTRAFEVFTRVLEGSLTDEPFGTLSDPSFRWLRITEDLFFRDGPSSLITSITSTVRRDNRSTRCNAYHRMFGIDLNHGASDGGAYPYVKAQTTNVDFVRSLQELLRELWRGFINVSNTSGPRTTDDTNIQELITKLRTMMTERRLSGAAVGQGRANLAREEFVAVATMEWFEMALDSDIPIVADLKASGDQPEDRLRKLGERVKLLSHARSRNFFQLARRLPRLLREIEEKEWEARPIAELYNPNASNNESDRTNQIVNHWSIATGVDLKAIPVATESR